MTTLVINAAILAGLALPMAALPLGPFVVPDGDQFGGSQPDDSRYAHVDHDFQSFRSGSTVTPAPTSMSFGLWCTWAVVGGYPSRSATLQSSTPATDLLTSLNTS